MQVRSTKEDSWCVLNGNTKGSFENSPLVDTPSKCALNVDPQLGAVAVVRVLLFIQVLSRKWCDQMVRVDEGIFSNTEVCEMQSFNVVRKSGFTAGCDVICTTRSVAGQVGEVVVVVTDSQNVESAALEVA